MKLILTLITKEASLDFQLNSELRIKDALAIISKNTSLQIDPNLSYIYSSRNEQMILTQYSFQEAKIYSGDKLIIEEGKV